MAQTPNALEDPLESHQKAIGALCMVWSFVDRGLDNLIQAALDCTYEDARAIGTALDSVSGRCNLLKNLASSHAPNNEWRALFRHLMNHIQGQLSVRRNRLVHDHWMSSESSEIGLKIDRRLKSDVDEDGLVNSLLYDAMEAVSEREIRDFIMVVLNAVIAMRYAERDLRMVTHEGPLATPLQNQTLGPSVLPPRQRRNNTPKQKPPRKSSRL